MYYYAAQYNTLREVGFHILISYLATKESAQEEEMKILTEITGKQCLKRDLFSDYIATIEKGTKGY